MGENEIPFYSVIKMSRAYANLNYVCRISFRSCGSECFVRAPFV
jgi:hypothetical protein